MKVGRGLSTLLAGVLAAVTLAGCSGGDDSPASRASTSTPSAAASTESPTLRNGVSALEELTVTACPSGDGKLKATGELRNYGTKSADYVVTVSWLDKNGGVVDTAFTVLENLLTRQKKSWTVTATLDQPASSCTTRVSRGNL